MWRTLLSLLEALVMWKNRPGAFGFRFWSDRWGLELIFAPILCRKWLDISQTGSIFFNGDSDIVRELGKKTWDFQNHINWTNQHLPGKVYPRRVHLKHRCLVSDSEPGKKPPRGCRFHRFFFGPLSRLCWRGDPNISETFRWGHFSHIQLGKSNGRMLLIPIGPVGSRWEFLAILPYKLPEVWNLTITTTLGLVPRWHTWWQQRAAEYWWPWKALDIHKQPCFVWPPWSPWKLIHSEAICKGDNQRWLTKYQSILSHSWEEATLRGESFCNNCPDTGGNWASAFRKSMKMVRVTMRLRICWSKLGGPKGPNNNSIMEEKTPWDWETVDELWLMVNAGWESPAIYGRCGWWWRRAYASWNQSQGAQSLQFGEHQQGTPKWIVLVSIHHKKSILKWDQGLFWMASKLRPCRDFQGQTRVAFSLCCAYGWSIGGEGAKHWESTGYLHKQTIQVKVSIQKSQNSNSQMMATNPIVKISKKIQWKTPLSMCRFLRLVALVHMIHWNGKVWWDDCSSRLCTSVVQYISLSVTIYVSILQLQ